MPPRSYLTSPTALIPSLMLLAGTLSSEDAPTTPPSPPPTPAQQAPPTPAANTPPSTSSTVIVNAPKGTNYGVGLGGSAIKLDLPDQQDPQSTTDISHDLFESRGEFSLRDALRNAPGVTLTAGEGRSTGDLLTIRGFVASTDIYLDGLKDNAYYPRDTFNLDHIEILRGPSAMLFGPGATGGAINDITKKPTDHWTGNAEMTVGAWNFLRDSIDINGPLVSDVVAGRLDAFDESTQSFRATQHDHREGIDPSVAVKVDDNTRVLLSVEHLTDVGSMDYGIPFINGRPAPVPLDTYYGFKDDSFQDNRASIFTGTIEERLGDHIIATNATRYGTYDRLYRIELLNSAPNPVTAIAPMRQVLTDNYQDTVDNQTDVTAKGKLFGHEASLDVGAEYSRNYYLFQAKNSTGTVNVNVLNPQLSNTWGPGFAADLSGALNLKFHAVNIDKAVYALGSFAITDQLLAVAGGRFDSFSTSYGSGAIIGTPIAVNLERTDGVFSPRGGLIYTPMKELSFYTSYSTSYDPSGEVYGLSTSTDDLAPEKNRSFEVGTKATLIDDKLYLTLDVFRQDMTNVREAAPPPAPSGTTILAGDQRTNGLELGINGNLTSRWTLNAGFAWYDALMVSSTATSANFLGTNVPIQGLRPTNVPTESGSLWSTYDLTHGFTFGAGLNATSYVYADAANSEKVPGYVRVDISLNYQTRINDLTWYAQANLFNVFNTKYYDAGSNNSTLFAMPGAPINAQLSLGMKF